MFVKKKIYTDGTMSSNNNIFNSPSSLNFGQSAPAPKMASGGKAKMYAMLLGSALVIGIILCVIFLIMGWVSIGKNTCPKQECPKQECPKQECPEHTCPDQECPTCPECPEQECPECPEPVRPTPLIEIADPDVPPPEILPPSVPAVPSEGVPVENCKTSPGCPKCMVWDGKRCRYPVNATLPAGLDPATCNTSPGCATCMVWDKGMKKCRYPKAYTSKKDAFMKFMYPSM